MSNPNIYTYPGVKAHLGSRIQHLEIAANPPTTVGKLTANHWRTFAVLSAQSSICFDMSVGGDGQTGLLILQDRPYAVTNQAIVSTILNFKKECTVQQLLDTITSKHRERYRFTANGDGCRYWVRFVVNAWEQEGLLAAGSTAKLDEIILYIWNSKTSKTKSEPAAGTFY